MDNVCGYKIKTIDKSYADFLTELEQADLILTPTRRLATRLNQDYAQLKKNVWQIDIISMNGWVERLWQDHQDNADHPCFLRLNDWQNQIFWQNITDNNPSMAYLAQQAWSLLKDWNIDFASIDSANVSSDIQVFLNWCQQYQEACTAKNFIDKASVLNHLKPAREHLNKIYLIGFTDIKPSIQKIIESLKKQGVHLEILEYCVPNAQVHCAPQLNIKDELIQAALWAKNLIAQNPKAPIGIIIPDLASRFSEVDDIFSRILMPETLLANHYHDKKTYNISSGKKLIDFPIIAKALELLKTNQDLHNWPGDRVLNSEEYQVVKRFYELLNEAAMLDLVQPRSSYYNLLYQQASNIIFQGESEYAPIQILGALEGEGLYFHALWVTGLHHENWPPVSKPHPFLPIDLQRENNMPHASSEREYTFAAHLTQRFTQQAHQVILSYPLQEDDKRLIPSRLISDYPILNNKYALPDCEFYDKNLILESWNDLPVPLKSKQKMKGGIGLLQSQSVCPFQAFARYRLKARTLEPEQTGLTYAQRGELVHAALEFFWKNIKSSDNLNLDQSEAIKNAVNFAVKKLPVTMHIELEKNRLNQLLMQWLKYEKNRPAFNVIDTEKNIEINFENLTLHARIDRIDQLATGEILLIDYKTGQANITEVQLPLYAISQPQASGVAIAKVKANEHHLQIIDDYELPWNEMLAQWEQTLSTLADDFTKGEAQVSPDGEQTCRYCDLELLCRVRSKQHG
ncbi:MAG: PD-(D/E)XK nuclease family protein [Legionellales bacterium]